MPAARSSRTVGARVAPSCLPDPLLARGQRMRNGEDFRHTIRRGARGAQPTLVTHVVPGTGGHTSVGFVVSKAVGSAAQRNRVKRQLRHLMRARVDALPGGSRVVVRALPSSQGADSSTLAEHLDAALARSGVR
ncbi:ribonuclease P protein component [Aeromicrobium wangtongii]|uniref:Ribonuclease P protein component n=1 Tax=Aeromicrobium wangtongii TaxID=2969247 RepID=A0ABY5M9E0_9ACTN|nr:ribonuclease P protein component [Aeromicrobium wangtongii]UUP13734.1 ribonuclease P protein component [Aeromicrobium wangtongii]